MHKPTLYVLISQPLSVEGPMKFALGKIAESAGATVVDELFTAEETEVDIVLTTSAVGALRMIQETEKATIVVAHFGKDGRQAAENLAGRYELRVLAYPMVEDEGTKNILQFLEDVVAKKQAEKEVV